MIKRRLLQLYTTTLKADNLLRIKMNKWERKVKKITDEVLKEIKPTTEETDRMLVGACKIIKAIKDELGDDVRFTIGGSLGKGTNLRQK